MKEQTTATNVPTDDIIIDPILEIRFGEAWVPADKDIWEAWTGLRRINGEDYHGPVHPVTHPDRIWTGSRVCPCKTCQAHTEPKLRPN